MARQRARPAWVVWTIATAVALVLFCGIPIAGLVRVPWSRSEPPSCGSAESEIVRSAAAGDREAVTAALDDGASVDTRDPHGFTPLYCSAAEGHVTVARVLLDRKGDPNQRSFEGDTPLAAAVRGDHDAVVELLLARGADPDAGGRNRDHPLALAAARTDVALARSLLDQGADPNGVISSAPVAGSSSLASSSPLEPLAAAIDNGSTELSVLLLDRGADPNRSNVLAMAVREDRLDLVTLLLDRGADPNRGDAVNEAFELEELDTARLLLERGGVVLDQARVFDAIESSDAGFVRLVLEHGGNANAGARQVWEGTPLMLAAGTQGPEVLQALLDHGARPNGHGRFPTPLQSATFVWRLDNVDVLLAAGADPNSAGAVDAAAMADLVRLVIRAQPVARQEKLLPDFGIYFPFPRGDQARADPSPLLTAAAAGNNAAIEHLVAAGADVNRLSFGWYSPIYVAAVFGHAETVKVLRRLGAVTQPPTDGVLSPAQVAHRMGDGAVEAALTG